MNGNVFNHRIANVVLSYDEWTRYKALGVSHHRVYCYGLMAMEMMRKEQQKGDINEQSNGNEHGNADAGRLAQSPVRSQEAQEEVIKQFNYR
jgi:hypothetical protein